MLLLFRRFNLFEKRYELNMHNFFSTVIHNSIDMPSPHASWRGLDLTLTASPKDAVTNRVANGRHILSLSDQKHSSTKPPL